MRHVYQLADAQPAAPTLVAVGMFDGVHRGHQFLLRRLVQAAHEQGWIPTVLTFFPHPDVVLGRASGRYYLTTPEQRATLLGRLGVELVVTHPFNDEVRQMRAADFVDRLIADLRLRALWIGPDFALGYKREGNVEFLRVQGQAKGFDVEVVQLVTNDNNGKIINSNGIRAALNEGRVEQAAEWLGRPYQLAGEVVHGDGRGRTIGFPTANLDVWVEQVLPENGIYAGWAYLDGEKFMSVANVGNRPTFGGKEVRVEAHLLDFDRDIYGRVLAFDFVARLRPELK
ncbi:MAG TPA: riboflavin biosynthesis protein RibF, partial [Aggregatilineaceae bacterium]|nr:riboflavin biosynthesis protein RibF [Aggregatilineaceae bacterium]